MTNGEMIQKVFNCEVCEPILEDDIIHVIFSDKNDSAIGFDWSWWNMEYEESTTNNDCAEQNGCITCSLDEGDDCCRKLFEESMQESITKNDLGVDCISSADARKAIIDHQYSDSFCEEHNIDHSINTGMALIALSDLSSVTLQELRKGHWIVQPSNKEQRERDFIWWKCSECGQVIFSETEKDRKEFHAFCGRCGANMESGAEDGNVK